MMVRLRSTGFASRSHLVAGIMAVTVLLFLILATTAKRNLAAGVLVPEKPNLEWSGEFVQGSTPAYAEVQYTVTNKGKQPVRILSVESGCGCATPEVEPRVVPPNQHSIVTVRAIPPSTGSKVVRFVLHTDSPARPDVELNLRMVLTRRVPFLQSIRGDLTFNDDDSSGSRRFVVTTVESKERTLSPCPVPSSSLITAHLSEVADLPQEDGTVLRQYTFEARFREAPSQGTFTGLITVKDPWDESSEESLPVLRRSEMALRATPHSLNLSSSQATQSFLVIANGGIDQLETELQGLPPSRVVLESFTPVTGAKSHRFRVKLVNPEDPFVGTGAIVLSTPSGSHRVTVPLRIGEP